MSISFLGECEGLHKLITNQTFAQDVNAYQIEFDNAKQFDCERFVFLAKYIRDFLKSVFL